MENPDDNRVVRVTNISNFDFTPEMGARYGGRDFPLRAGEDRLYPFPLADHLATHLARQIVLKKAPIRDEKEIDGKGSTIALWDEAGLNALKAKILTDVYTEEKKAPVSQDDLMQQRVADLNASDILPKDESNLTDSPNGALDASALGIPAGGPQQGSSDLVYKDKAEVIAELQKRGKIFNPRASKASLETMLNDAA